MSAVASIDVWKFYGDFPALRDIRLQRGAGPCLALLGRNGAGKTTLLRIIAGCPKPARAASASRARMSARRQTRRRIGVLGHGIGVYDELSAFENLRLFANLYGMAESRQARDGMAGAHRPRSCARRAGSRVLARHAAAAGGRARIPA